MIIMNNINWFIAIMFFIETISILMIVYIFYKKNKIKKMINEEVKKLNMESLAIFKTNAEITLYHCLMKIDREL